MTKTTGDPRQISWGTSSLINLIFAPLSLAVIIIAFLAGGWVLWACLVYVVLAATLLDFVWKSEDTTTGREPPDILVPTALLSLAAALAFAFFVPHAPMAELVVGTLIAGVAFGTIANVAGHELIHQDDQPARFALGMALESLALDPADTVGHDLHHELVATPDDPSSAQRGESYWHFLLRSVPGAALGAGAMERERLTAIGRSVWTPGNRLLQAAAIQCAVVGMFWLVGSWRGVAAFLAAGILARIIVEATKYSSHYGLVRKPGRPVEIRHSWNSKGGVSSRAMFNAGWHSDHHVNGERPYREIILPDDAPINPYPAGLTFVMALVPPVWFLVMDPLVDMWRREFASREEQAIASAQPRTTGWGATSR